MQRSEDALQPFDVNDDDKEVISDLFREIDVSGDGSISMEELQNALKRFEGLEMAKVLQDLTKQKAQTDKEIDLPTFIEFVQKLPRIRGERVRWAETLKLDAHLARFLAKGDIFDGLKSLRTCNDDELEEMIQNCCQKFTTVLPHILRNGLKELRSSNNGSTVVQQHINSKFVLDGAFVGQFATLSDFYNGPEALIGVPNPKIFVGAEKEHCFRVNAQERFNTSNYNIDTYPALEWEFVVCPKEDGDYPHTPRDKSKWKKGNSWRGDHGRDVIKLDNFLSNETIKPILAKAELRNEEVICLRLYTGPMFVLYNASLRKFPAWDVEHLKGNQYETTIFVIASGITKLSKVTGIPADRKLYRGLGGMILPDHFWKNFEECQITFTATFVSAELADAARGSLNEHVKNADQGVLGSKHSLSVRLLNTEKFWGSFPWEGAKTCRVMRLAAATENRVTMVVALSMSKFDFRDRQHFFKDSLVACIQPPPTEASPVIINLDEVADKPVDFKGGGLHPPSNLRVWYYW
jgi:Ca2+-binding EF-hand superfamily protein